LPKQESLGYISVAEYCHSVVSETGHNKHAEDMYTMVHKNEQLFFKKELWKQWSNFNNYYTE